MRAAILAVGSELLGTERLDTNSLAITTCLERHGVSLVRKSAVGDDVVAIAEAVVDLSRGIDVLVVTGGLGPTADDRTRAGVGRACRLALTECTELIRALEARYAARGRTMAPVNRRQAQVLDGAIVLDNRRGSAPGQRLEHAGTTMFLFPGPPRELAGMLGDHLVPWLARTTAERGEPGPRPRHVFKTTGVPESEVEQGLLPLYERFGEEAIALLARPGEVTIVVSPIDATALQALVEAVRATLGAATFAERANATLEGVVGELLLQTRKTVTTAESCTGGLLGGAFTAVAGSSAFYHGGVVTYSNALKEGLLGVPNERMVAHGAVSAPVAEAMARGVRARLAGDFGIGITGIAGPGGGSDDKPVGTVFLALAGDGVGDDGVVVERAFLTGDRALVREQSVSRSLDLLRRHLMTLPAAATVTAVGQGAVGQGAVDPDTVAPVPAGDGADRLAAWEG